MKASKLLWVGCGLLILGMVLVPALLVIIVFILMAIGVETG